MKLMDARFLPLFFSLLLLISGVSSVSAANLPVKIVSGFISRSLSRLMRWVWSLKASTKNAITGRSMMKYEGGYSVETVFDGSKLGVHPYSVEVLPNGQLLILDSANSNLYRISSPLSLYSRPKLVAGSWDGYAGHVDGEHREAKMNHPKGVAVDDRGNIYVADTMNMAIRKISDAGVTTIAGGKWSSHADETKLSNDFDVVYVGSSCSLLVIDRGNRAIREIQLQFDDCANQYETSFPLGIVLLLAAAFFGYMLALLQLRVRSILHSHNDVRTPQRTTSSPHQKPPKSVRLSLITTEDQSENQEEGFFGSLGKLFVNAGTSAMEIVGAILPVFKRKAVKYEHQNQRNFQQYNSWQTQESFEIPKQEEPPSIESRGLAPDKVYPYMSDAEKAQHQPRQSPWFYSGWNGEIQQQQQQQQLKHQHHLSMPQTYYEQSSEKTNEIVFGAVQEEGRHNSIIRPTYYAMDPQFNHQNVRYRTGYNRGYQYNTW